MLENIETKLHEKSNQKIVRGLVAFVIFMASLPSLSAELGSSSDSANLINPNTKEVNLSRLAQLQHAAGQRALRIENYVSYASLPQYDNGSRAGLKILGQAAKAVFTNQQSNTAAQQLVNRAPKVVKSAQTGNVNFSVNLSATSAQAELKYGNAIKGEVSYDPTANGMKVELSHPIGVNRSLAYTHGSGNYGGVEDKVGIRWGF